jgi:hypothetical protein
MDRKGAAGSEQEPASGEEKAARENESIHRIDLPGN